MVHFFSGISNHVVLILLQIILFSMVARPTLTYVLLFLGDISTTRQWIKHQSPSVVRVSPLLEGHEKIVQ